MGQGASNGKNDVNHDHALKKYGAVYFGGYRKIQILKYTGL